jgi:hypothetical protein
MARSQSDVKKYFSGYPQSFKIYKAIERAGHELGPMEVAVSQSQVSFRTRRAFAWMWIPAQYLTGDRPPLVLSIALRRRDKSKRWKEVVEPRNGWFMHHLELTTEAEADAEVAAWLKEARELVDTVE